MTGDGNGSVGSEFKSRNINADSGIWAENTNGFGLDEMDAPYSDGHVRDSVYQQPRTKTVQHQESNR